ncbi:MAG: ADP-ribosylation factor-like protein, partial [Candidatus Hodarchaeales archaeon]
MKAWVSHSDVHTKLGYKILLAGLSESGKTAVKRIFFLKHTTEEVDDLLATINYERLTMSIRDVPLTIVDLGGQRIFLKRFLSGFSPFVFSSIKSLIFLVDVANKTVRNDAIQYSSACIKKLQVYSPEAEAFIFLHKNDLIRDSPNYESIHEQMKEQFQLEYSKKLRFFRTSIYNPESVIDSFGRIFELAIPELAWSEFVDERTVGLIEEFAEKDITFRETSIKTIEEPETTEIVPRKIGDLAAKDKLEKLMQEKLKSKTEISQYKLKSTDIVEK